MQLILRDAEPSTSHAAGAVSEHELRLSYSMAIIRCAQRARTNPDWQQTGADCSCSTTDSLGADSSTRSSTRFRRRISRARSLPSRRRSACPRGSSNSVTKRPTKTCRQSPSCATQPGRCVPFLGLDLIEQVVVLPMLTPYMSTGPRLAVRQLLVAGAQFGVRHLDPRRRSAPSAALDAPPAPPDHLQITLEANHARRFARGQAESRRPKGVQGH